MPVIHSFPSTIGDEVAAGRVRPTEWNAPHTVSVDLATEVTGPLDKSHISGLTVSQFASSNISQWTNDSGYSNGTVTVTDPLSKSGNNISLNLNARLVNNAGNLDLQSGVISAPGTYTSVTIDTYGRVTAGTAIGASKFNGTITGDGSTTQFNVTHSLGNRDPVVMVRDSSHNMVLVDNQGTSTNVVQITFATAPANSTVYNVIVIG